MSLYITGIAIFDKDIRQMDDVPFDLDGFFVEMPEKQEVFPGHFCRFREPHIANDVKFYPKMSDIKVMRTDVVASVISCLELFENLQIQDSEKLNMALLVANSNFIDNENLTFESLAPSIEMMNTVLSDAEKNHQFGVSISPLLPLKTLTNSTESFIAQYCKISGPNSTYGSTSVSPFQALEDAITFLELDQCTSALVGGSNFAGTFSYSMNYQQIPKSDTYLESTASSFIFIETLENAEKHGRKPLAKIVDLHFNEPLASQDNLIVFGGAFNNLHYKQLLEKYNHLNIHSWYPSLGNLGAASMGFGITYALKKFDQGVSRICIFEENIFGNSASLTIVKP